MAHIEEHEPEIVTTHGKFKQSQLKDVVVIKGELKKETPKHCPLMKRGCTERCAYHEEKGCIIVTGGELQSGVCPYNQLYTCGDTCAVHADNKCLLRGAK